jgi:hypothetical protein
MPSPKHILYILSILFIFYISACIVSEFDINTLTSKEIQQCFHAYNKTNNPSNLEIAHLILGTWELSLDTQYYRAQFLSNSTYFIYNGNLIIQTGKYRIIEDSGIFAIKSIPEYHDINGIINICTNYIYNETTDRLWVKRW